VTTVTDETTYIRPVGFFTADIKSFIACSPGR